MKYLALGLIGLVTVACTPLYEMTGVTTEQQICLAAQAEGIESLQDAIARGMDCLIVLDDMNRLDV